jgi:hypothetical protein
MNTQKIPQSSTKVAVKRIQKSFQKSYVEKINAQHNYMHYTEH